MVSVGNCKLLGHRVVSRMGNTKTHARDKPDHEVKITVTIQFSIGDCFQRSFTVWLYKRLFSVTVVAGYQ